MLHARTILMFVLTGFLVAVADRQAVSQTLALGGDPIRDAGPRSSEITLADLSGPKAWLFDRFGAITSNNEKARLDNFAIELNQQGRGAVGYIIVFGRSGRPTSEAKKRADNAAGYLKYYNKTSNAIESIYHCPPRAQVEYELWIRPEGATPVLCPTPARTRIRK